MSGLPAEYYHHELKKLFGDYKPKATMPCFRCDEPEGAEIRFAFAIFAAALHDRLPPGTMPATGALLAPGPEPAVESGESSPGTGLEGLFILRDYVIGEDTIMAAAIKAAGGLRMLARKLGIQSAAVEQWKRVPVERLQAAVKVTGLPRHVLRPDLFDVSDPLPWCTEEEADEIWRWGHARQLWLPLPYPPGFLPARCCARRVHLKLVTE